MQRTQTFKFEYLRMLKTHFMHLCLSTLDIKLIYMPLVLCCYNITSVSPLSINLSYCIYTACNRSRLSSSLFRWKLTSASMAFTQIYLSYCQRFRFVELALP